MQKPVVPDLRAELDPRITQLHSSDYRNLVAATGRGVLVVGASHSGADIAYEAAAEHQTILSGRDTGQIPASVESRRGRLGFRVLFFLGHARADGRHAARPQDASAHPARRRAAAARTGRRTCSPLESSACSRVPSASRTGCRCSTTAASSTSRNVIWCTGFRPDYTWIDVPLELGEDGYPVSTAASSRRRRACTSSGCSFLHSFASMLIAGAGRDAERVAKHLVARSSNGRVRAASTGPVATLAEKQAAS